MPLLLPQPLRMIAVATTGRNARTASPSHPNNTGCGAGPARQCFQITTGTNDTPPLPAAVVCLGVFCCFAFHLANAAEWTAWKPGVWNFECKTRSPSDLPDTAQSWHRCSVASNHPPLRALDTTAHFEP